MIRRALGPLAAFCGRDPGRLRGPGRPRRPLRQLVVGSMMDGKAHRELLMAMVAGQLPAQMPWQMPPGYWPQQGMQPPGQPGEQDEDEDGQQDKRPALVKLFGRKAPDPKQNHIKRNGRGSKR